MSALLHAAAIVFRKEAVDNLRDRRTVLTSVGIAVGAPLLFAVMISFALDGIVDDAEAPLRVAISGAERAPNLIDWLERHRVEVVAAPEDPEAAVRTRAEDVVLVIDAGFGERLAAGRPAPVRLVYDSARRSSSGADARRLQGLLESWSEVLGRQRLVVRGVSPDLVRPLAVEDADVASPGARALMLLAMVPYFIVYSVFIGGFYLAIDTTAGEREQGTLEPLLALPVPRAALVLGKLCATLAFALATLLLVCLSFAVAIGQVPLGELGMSVQYDLGTALLLTLAVAPLAVLAAALLTVIASFTRSFKEAQTWLTIVVMVPVLPLLFVAFSAPEATPATMLVPSLAQSLLVNLVIEHGTLDPLLFVASLPGTLIPGGVLAWIAVRLYERESLLG